MAQAILFINGEMIRQRGVAAPKKATLDRWLKALEKTFTNDLEAAGLGGRLELHKGSVEPHELRLSCRNGAAFLVNREQDAMAR